MPAMTSEPTMTPAPTPTPRTDECLRTYGNPSAEMLSLTRTLERELFAARQAAFSEAAQLERKLASMRAFIDGLEVAKTDEMIAKGPEYCRHVAEQFKGAIRRGEVR